MPTGVEIRGDAIRISVQYQGQRLRFTYPLDGSKKSQLHRAAQIRKKMLAEIAAGTFFESEYRPDSHKDKPQHVASDTFDALADDYLASIGDLAAGTRKKYQQAANFWKRTLAAWTLRDFTYPNLRKLLDGIKWSSPKTRNNVVSVLRQMLKLWADEKKLDGNPAARLKNWKVQKPMPDPLTGLEVDSVLTFMNKNYPEEVSNYFEFMLKTGLRPEEAIALRVTDVFIDIPGVMDCVHVSKAFTSGQEKPTKTHCVRDVELNEGAKVTVQRQLALSNAHGLQHLFFNPTTKAPWKSEKSQRVLYWYPALDGCGIRRRVAYQTRHTFASLSLSAGAQPLWLAGQMGHSTPKMVYERYARWIQGRANSQEYKKIESMFARKPCP